MNVTVLGAAALALALSSALGGPTIGARKLTASATAPSCGAGPAGAAVSAATCRTDASATRRTKEALREVSPATLLR